MPVPQEVFAKIKDQLGDWGDESTPAVEQPKSDRAQKGFSLVDSTVEGAKELGASALTGFARGSDFIKGIGAGIVMPFIPEGDTPAAKAAYSILRPSMDTLSPETKQRAESPKTIIGKVLGPMAEGVGGMATMPIPGGTLGQAVVRNVLSGAGMGEGSEIGKYVGGGIVGAMEPDARKYGEAAGSILGGGLGAQLNVSRGAALGELLKAPISAAAKIKPAYQAAKAQQAVESSLPTDEQRKLYEIFADEFGNLRASTRGIIGQYTDRELASAISRDVRAMSEVEKFGEDVKKSGLETSVSMPKEGRDVVVRPFGLAERTMTPTLTMLARERAPKTFQEGLDIKEMASARQKAISDAYNKIAGDKPVATNQGAEAAANLLQKVTQEKLDALTMEQQRIKDSFPTLTSRDEYALGENLREQRDTLNKQSLAVANQKYAQAEGMFDKEGVQIGAQGIRDKGKDILEEFIAQANPAEVPPVVRSILGATAPKQVEGSLIISPYAKPATTEPTTLSLKDANDLTRALTKMATTYRQANRYPEMNRALGLKNEVLSAIDQSPASEEAKQAYLEARRYWAEEHAPRFREDIGKALGEERGGVFQGRESVEGQTIADKFMKSEPWMIEFDRIYGNNPQARTSLSTALEGRFRDNVMKGNKTPAQFELMADNFNQNYAAALERFPQVAQKIDQQTSANLSLMKEQEAETSRFKDLMKGPVAMAIGPVQAKVLYSSVLADPVKMDQLLASIPKAKGDVAKQMVKELFLQANPMKSGDYDAAALVDMLAAGKSDPAIASSMERLFTAAYGKDLAKHQMESLQALADISLREAATNPNMSKAGELMSQAPVKQATGQTMASWISAWRAREQGVTGRGYFTILGLSRFANAKAQAAVEKAKLEALYDPDKADAILEMAKTPITQTLSKSVLGKIFGNITAEDGRRIVDKLTDKGFVEDHLGRGYIYGSEKGMSDEQKRQDVQKTPEPKRVPGVVYFDDLK